MFEPFISSGYLLCSSLLFAVSATIVVRWTRRWRLPAQADAPHQHCNWQSRSPQLPSWPGWLFYGRNSAVNATFVRCKSIDCPKTLPHQGVNVERCDSHAGSIFGLGNFYWKCWIELAFLSIGSVSDSCIEDWARTSLPNPRGCIVAVRNISSTAENCLLLILLQTLNLLSLLCLFSPLFLRSRSSYYTITKEREMQYQSYVGTCTAGRRRTQSGLQISLMGRW